MDKDDETRVTVAGDNAPAEAAGRGPAGMPEPGVPPELGAFVSGTAYAVLGLLGGLIGLLGSFVQDWTAGSVPIAAIALVLVVFGFVWLAGRGMGSRLGAVVPAFVWGLVVFVMSMRRPEGDLVVPGTLAGYVYIIGGLVAAVFAVSRVPSSRPPGEWLLGRAARRGWARGQSG